ncbi:hypothetical protein QQ045_007838 [Rhodiola kirilowii]
MASNDSHKNLPELMFEDVRQQIGLAVRRIQWSYAIFWSVTQPGILKWCTGFYNGEIKTNSKAQAADQNGEEICSQRSDQLRELFESLAASESNNPQAKKLHSALSPEDLSEPEWFYMLCMSFIFNAGRELPGKALEKGQPVWLCNAHLADNKVFGRSLLAKTVACFPVTGGVVELGVTEKVAEDAAIIQRITNYLRDYKSMASKGSDLTTQKPSSSTDHVCSALNILDAHLAPMMSPHTSTTELGLAELEDSFMADIINEEVPHLQNWQFIDEDLNDYLHNTEEIIVSEKLDHPCRLEPPECNKVNYGPLGLPDDEMHYQSVISAILQTSVIGSQYGNTNKASSFVSCRKAGCVGIIKPDDAMPQRMLKKILTEVPKMHCDGLLEALAKDDKNVVQTERGDTCIPEAEDLVDMDLPEAEETGLNHVLAERRRREKLKRRFLVLRSLVPTTTKVDKVSILDDTIKYLKELERRIGELESAKENTANTVKTKVRKCQGHDTNERTSDNYELEESTKPKALKKKRKACHADKNHAKCASSKDKYNDNLLVEVEDKDLRIEVKCAWRRQLLPELMETLSNLNIESPSMQIHIVNGILSLKITSKLQGLKIASTKIIKQEIQRIVNSC